MAKTAAPRTVIGFTSGPTTSGMMNWHAAQLDCGHLAYAKGWQPSTLTLGEAVTCETCVSQAERIEWLRNLSEPVFRARFDPRFGGLYHLYRRDKNSPSGVLQIGSVPAIPEIDAVLAEKRISPLSPTEERVF